jgi:hypothetical protein
MAAELTDHMFDQPRPAISYSSDEVLSDALAGVPAVGLILVTALFLGGFSFFTPWMIVTPPIFFAAGLVRARSESNPLLKGLVISLPLLGVAALLGNPRVAMVGFSAIFSIPPCAIGVWIRRRKHWLSPE